MVNFLDIDPLSPGGMMTAFVLIAIAYLLIVSGGWTFVLGSLLVIAVAFVVYAVTVRFYRWSIGASGGRKT